MPRLLCTKDWIVDQDGHLIGIESPVCLLPPGTDEEAIQDQLLALRYVPPRTMDHWRLGSFVHVVDYHNTPIRTDQDAWALIFVGNPDFSSYVGTARVLASLRMLGPHNQLLFLTTLYLHNDRWGMRCGENDAFRWEPCSPGGIRYLRRFVFREPLTTIHNLVEWAPPA